jgi:hypothetical protein
MTEMEMDTTKITFKIYKPLLADFEKQIRAAFIKRDAFINHMIKTETQKLSVELGANVLSKKARLFISRELQKLGTKTINVVVDKSTAEELNKAVKKHNLVRDAFLNRLVMFLLSRDRLLQYLGLPNEIMHQEFESCLESLPTSPLGAIRSINGDPFFYLRVASFERLSKGLYLLELPEKFIGLTCYLEDRQIPGSDEYLYEQSLLQELVELELEAFTLKNEGDQNET